MIRRIALIPLATLLLLSIAPAQYTEDRDNRSPSAGYWVYNATASTVSSIARSYRVVDIEVTATSPSYRFTVAYVPNAGTYKKSWWWYYGLTGSAVTSYLSANKARLTDIEVYNTSSGLRFTVLMESNATNGKGWWWYYGSSLSSIMAQASRNGARVVDLEQYTVGSSTYYAAVMLRNTGKDAKSWWLYANVSQFAVNSYLSKNSARIWDLDRLSNGNYNVTMVRWSGEQVWYWYARTASDVNKLALQYGARLVDVQQYSTSSGTRFDVVFISSTDPLSARIRDLMLARTDGSMGAHLRRIPLTGSGYDLAGVNHTTRYEPASTLKTLHHVTTMRDVYLSRRYLTSKYSVKYATPSGSCPQTTTPYTLTLEDILKGMMQKSNNSYTHVITDLYGMSGLTSSAASMGMPNTAIHRHMGCAPLTNYSTLRDLGTLHEKVIKGYLGSQRQKFYQLMNNGISSAMSAVVSSEAKKLSMTSSQVNSFLAGMQITGKGGNDYVTYYNRSWYGYAKLPIWQNGGMSSREYAFGAWVNDARNDAKAADAVNVAVVEILRNEIANCLATLKNHVFGSFSKFGSSCGGSLSPFAHTASGVPELGQLVSYIAKGNRSGTQLTSLEIGGSRTYWGRIPLPLHLAFMGAPNCYWRTDSLIEANMPALNGVAALSAYVPFTKSLLGLQLHTQFIIVDPGANKAGLTATNGITTTIGGQR